MHRTPLYQAHLAAGARMVEFTGWEMPIHYGSQIDEHHRVRSDAGMFDVSHMTVVDIRGPRTREFLSYLLANDIAKLQQPGKALYSCMLKDQGTVIDDLIAYFLSEEWFRLVVNAANHDKDLAWLEQQGERFSLSIKDHSDLAMIAVQGPQARARVASLLSAEDARAVTALNPFTAEHYGDLFIARTGYTGEDGFELTLPAIRAESFWQRLLEVGVTPCGLGARDTLRLEAGMNLYGQDMDENVTPMESGLGWTVAMKNTRRFIGREAIESQIVEGISRQLLGLVLESRGVLRPQQKVMTDRGEGETTSGGFAPTLQRAIAFARIPTGADPSCEVEIRGKLLPARLVKPPFVRNGNACVGIL